MRRRIHSESWSSRTWLALAVMILGMAIPGGVATAQQGTAPEFEYRYHTYAEAVDMLRGLTTRYPELATLYSIGESATGARELYVIELTNQATGPSEEKPAVYFDGNQHDSEVMGGQVSLHLAHFLLTGYAQRDDIRELLDTRVVYILPLANPDGAEFFITGRVDWDPEKIENADRIYPPGKRGADGPEDITGDGNILQMRVPDPDGEWKKYDAEPRIMVRREPDDTEGPFYRIYQEGYDSDGDGEVNNDPPFTRFITNRNYPAFWSSADGRYRGAGEYPLDEHNSRLIVDFIVSNPNISQIESFHTTSGVHLRPFSARPDSDMPQQDLEDYQALLAKGTRITTYPQASVYHQFTTIDPNLSVDDQPGARRGVFIDWGYSHFGALTTTTELWTMEPFVNEVGWDEIPRDEPLFAIPGRYNRPDVQAKVLEWLDRNSDNPDLSGQGFVDWAPFDHPTLGKVEIGGFTRYWLRNPPPGPYYGKVAVDQAEFALTRSLMTPLVRIRDVEVEEVSAGRRGRNPTWRIRAQVANEGWLDTSLEQARRTGIARPDQIMLELPEGARTANDPLIEIPFMRGTRGSEFISYYYGEWEVEAPAGSEITIVVRSEKGGTHRERVRLGGGVADE